MDDFIAGDVSEVTQKLAYEYWQRRGCPLGSPDVDWLAAEKELGAAQRRDQPFSLFGLSPEPNEESNR